ncbi:MAG: T9SS type A sorting domain-containing protein, partial [Bacteroidota bacterium]
KFFDANKNGVRDMIAPITGGSILEPSIPDWKIYLALNSEIVDSQLTDVNGNYQFTELVAGNYIVSEEKVSGWVQTFPALNSNHNVSLTSSGQNVTEKYFGNRKNRRGMKVRGLRSDSLWSNRLNWDGNVAPSNEDSIEISSGDTIYVDAVPFDSLQSLTVSSGGRLVFPNNIGTMKLRSNFVIDGLVDVNNALPTQFAPKFYVYGNFVGDGLFNPGKSKVTMKGNNAKIVGGSLNGKASDTTTFYELEIAGNNTTAGSDITILSKLTLSADLSTSDENIITIDSAIAEAISGAGKINRGKIVRKIGTGDIGSYRFHSSYNKIQYSGNGIPPTYLSMSRYPDSTESGFGKYRVEKSGAVDTNNNAVTVSGLTHFSRWVMGQTGHKDSTGSPTYDITEEGTAKMVTDTATLTLEYDPSTLTYSEDSVALYRIASGITVRKWLDADKDTNTTNDRTAKTWGLRVRNEDGSLLSSVNVSELSLEEVSAGTYTVVESDSARWTHMQTLLNGSSIGSSDSVFISVAEGELAVIDFINNYQPDTTKYRTFLSDLYTGKAPSLKPKKGKVPFLTTPANIRNNVVTKATGLTIGTARVDSAKAYGWMVFSEGKSMEKYFPAVAGTKAHPFDSVYITGKKTKAFVKALKNAQAKKFENHLATELAAFRINDMASRTTPKVLSEGILGSLIYNDATMDSFNLNGKSLSKIVDSANIYLTHYKRIPSAKRDAYFSALDSIFSRANREFYIGAITAEDTAHTPSFKVKRGKKVSESTYFTSPTTKEEEFSPIAIGNAVPEVFSLAQNYPNPFNPATTIEFNLPADAFVSLKIYNVLGQEIKTLFDNELLEGGFNAAEFDASHFASGVYFYRLSATTVDDISLTSVRKMILMK